MGVSNGALILESVSSWVGFTWIELGLTLPWPEVRLIDSLQVYQHVKWLE